MTLQFALEHPKGSGLAGAVHNTLDTSIVRTNHGEVVATQVQVGWFIYTFKNVGAEVLSIAEG